MCCCVFHRPVEGGIPESQSWVTARAKEMSKIAGPWSTGGHSEDGLGSMTNSQVDGFKRHTQEYFQCNANTIQLKCILVMCNFESLSFSNIKFLLLVNFKNYALRGCHRH